MFQQCIMRKRQIRGMNPKTFWEFVQKTYPIFQEFWVGISKEEYIELILLHHFDQVEMHADELLLQDKLVGLSFYFLENWQGARVMYRFSTNIISTHQGQKLYTPFVASSINQAKPNLDYVVFKTQNPRVFGTLTTLAGGKYWPNWSGEPIPSHIHEMAKYYAGEKYTLDGNLVIHGHPIYREKVSQQKTFHEYHDRDLVAFMEKCFGHSVNEMHDACFQVVCEVEKN